MQQKHPDPICTKLIQLLKYSVTTDKIRRKVLYTIYNNRRSLTSDFFFLSGFLPLFDSLSDFCRHFTIRRGSAGSRPVITHNAV